MSIDIAWNTITSGTDGEALAEKIRAFVHDRFQQIVLPRFIKSVHVHSFEFGSACPEIEIKDICDPLPDFYEEEGDDGADGEDGEGFSDTPTDAQAARADGGHISANVAQSQLQRQFEQRNPVVHPLQAAFLANPSLDPELHTSSIKRQERSSSSDLSVAPFARSGTPGIPGGTSNLSYFHMPMGGLSGTQTPLAAVASGTPFSPGTFHQSHFGNILLPPHRQGQSNHGEWEFVDPSSRPSTANTLPSLDAGSPFNPSSPENHPLLYPQAEKVSDDPSHDPLCSPPPLRLHPSQPSDLQVVARVQYSGDVRMTLTAEILLDYPMPSFVGIPLKLSITGMAFDGVAILAYIKKRMHFCFLDPEDAQALVGDHVTEESPPPHAAKDSPKTALTGLLKEIRVESEIGRQESGKQVLKNVGKVEKFVLEQVRRIFEEEFVFPSFWTFLV